VTLGDLVKITFGPYERPTLGIFIRDDTVAIGEDKGGYPIITRAFVWWDGQIYSTSLDQVELISESR
tara:strand:+ start:1941 stop:2141 length:201 start_codon:yes stop_codon:yes gene_type:complete